MKAVVFKDRLRCFVSLDGINLDITPGKDPGTFRVSKRISERHEEMIEPIVRELVTSEYLSGRCEDIDKLQKKINERI